MGGGGRYTSPLLPFVVEAAVRYLGKDERHSKFQGFACYISIPRFCLHFSVSQFFTGNFLKLLFNRVFCVRLHSLLNLSLSTKIVQLNE